MPRRTIAESLKLGNTNTKSKKSSADRKRLTIGTSKAVKVKLPKITKIFNQKLPETEEEKKKKAAIAKAKAARQTKPTPGTKPPEGGGRGKDFLDDSFVGSKPQKSDELVTRKGVLGLNLVSTADQKRQEALDDDTIESRGSKDIESWMTELR